MHYDTMDSCTHHLGLQLNMPICFKFVKKSAVIFDKARTINLAQMNSSIVYIKCSYVYTNVLGKLHRELICPKFVVVALCS